MNPLAHTSRCTNWYLCAIKDKDRNLEISGSDRRLLTSEVISPGLQEEVEMLFSSQAKIRATYKAYIIQHSALNSSNVSPESVNGWSSPEPSIKRPGVGPSANISENAEGSFFKWAL